MFTLWFLIAIEVILVTFMVVALSNRFLGKWACRVFGWHLTPESQGFDGCSFTGVCPRCNEKILQDGQGNWF